MALLCDGVWGALQTQGLSGFMHGVEAGHWAVGL